MDIKNILYSNKGKPSFTNKKSEIKCSKELKEKNQFILNDFKKIKYGYDGNNFSFDNERPESKMNLHPFILSEFVTNEDWLSFIDDKGYKRPGIMAF